MAKGPMMDGAAAPKKKAVASKTGPKGPSAVLIAKVAAAKTAAKKSKAASVAKNRSMYNVPDYRDKNEKGLPTGNRPGYVSGGNKSENRYDPRSFKLRKQTPGSGKRTTDTGRRAY